MNDLVKQMSAAELGTNECMYSVMVERENNPVYRKAYCERLRIIRDEISHRIHKYGSSWRILDCTGV